MIGLPNTELKNPVLTPAVFDTRPITDPIEQAVQEDQRKKDAIEKEKRDDILKYGIYNADPIKFNSIKLQQQAAKDQEDWTANVANSVAEYKSRGKQIPASEIIKWKSGLTVLQDKIKLNNSIQSQAQEAAQHLTEDYEGKRYNHDETQKALEAWQKDGTYDPTQGFLREADVDIPAVLQKAIGARTTLSSEDLDKFDPASKTYTVKLNSVTGTEDQARAIFRSQIGKGGFNNQIAKEFALVKSKGEDNPDVPLPELGDKTYKQFETEHTIWASNPANAIPVGKDLVSKDLGIAGYWAENNYWRAAQLNVKQGEKEKRNIGVDGIRVGDINYKTLPISWGEIQGSDGKKIPMAMIPETPISEKTRLSGMGTNLTETEVNNQYDLSKIKNPVLVAVNPDRGTYAVKGEVPNRRFVTESDKRSPVIFNNEDKINADEIGGKGIVIGEKEEAKTYIQYIKIGNLEYSSLTGAQNVLSKMDNPSSEHITLVKREGGKVIEEIPLNLKLKKGEPSTKIVTLVKNATTDDEQRMLRQNDASHHIYVTTPEPEKYSKEQKSNESQEVWDKAKLDRYYQYVSGQTGLKVDDPKTIKAVDEHLKKMNIGIK